MQRRIFQIGDQAMLATRNGSYFETIGTLAQMVEAHLRELARHAAVANSPIAAVAEAGDGHAAVAAATSVVPASPAPTKPNHGVVPDRSPPPGPVADAVTVAAEGATDEDSEASPESGVDVGIPAQPKRGRGRPRKHPVPAFHEQKVEHLAISPTPAAAIRRQRGPGRPRLETKMFNDEVAVSAATDEPGAIIDVPTNMLSGGDELPAPQKAPSPRPPRVRGPKVPRWMIAGLARRGRLK